MVDPANPAGPAERTPEEVLAAIGADLAAGVEGSIGRWVEAAVARVADAWRPGTGAALAPVARAAGREAADAVGAELRALLALDPEQQPIGPLEVVRRAVRYPTAVLVDAQVPAVARDEFAQRAFPDDRYDLAPASFADVDPGLAELGIRWGAAKAFVILSRRRPDPA